MTQHHHDEIVYLSFIIATTAMAIERLNPAITIAIVVASATRIP